MEEKALFVFDLVLDVAGKNLPRGERNDFSVIFFDLGIANHGKLIGASDRSAGDFVYVARKFYKMFQWKYHS